MRLRKLILVFIAVLFAYHSFAQNKDELTQSRILILLDGSSSMIHKWAEGKEKFKAAGDLIDKLMDSVYKVNDQVEFSLRVFGHQHTLEEDYCYDTKNEVPFAKDNRLQMSLRLAALQPLGVTPIAYALEQAAEYDLTDEAHNAYSIILITDGGESCGGDICEVMQKLIKNKVFFKPYILSLEDDPQLKNTYACMGDYLQVTKTADIQKAVGVIVDAFKPVLKITPLEYKHLQNEVAKNKPTDTIEVKAIKTFKTDTLVPIIAPVHPPSVNVTAVGLAALRSVAIASSAEISCKEIPVPDLPPVVREKPAETKLAKVSFRQPVQFTVKPELAPAPGITVQMTALPPIAKDARVKIELGAIAINQPVQLPVKINRHILVNTQPGAQLHSFVPVGPDNETTVNTIELESTLPPIREEIVPLKKTAINNLSTSRPEVMASKPSTTVQLPVAAQVQLPAIVKETPPLKKSGLDAMAPAPTLLLNTTASNPATVKKDTIVVSLPPVVHEQPPHPVQKVPRARLAPPMKMGLLIVIDEKNYQPQPVPPLPPVKKEIAPKTGKPIVTKPDMVTVPPEKRAETRVETEDAKETTLEVYFTNGKGKYYQSTPQVVLVDPATNKDVKAFYRFVDDAGNPDPQKDIPAGTFNITFSAKRSLIAPNVHIEKDKRNKIYITVRNTSLSFQYANAPGRPMTEYTAVVTERNKAQGRVQRQKCTEKIEYEPENYHVEINTFPTTVKNLDLDFDFESTITIAQPGFLKFTNDVKAATVTLYFRDGDRFKPFSNLDPNDPKCQHLPIQPGEYQAHYNKGPIKSFATEQVVPFTILTTQVTEVVLK